MPNPWFVVDNAQDAIDCIEDLASVTAFLKDCISQTTPFQLSDNGQNGLYFLLVFMESTMNRAVNQLVKRRAAL